MGLGHFNSCTIKSNRRVARGAGTGGAGRAEEGGGRTAVSAFVKLPCGSRWRQPIPGKGEWEGLATFPLAWSDQGPWEEIAGWGRKSLP